MAHDNTIFSQLLKLISRHDFETLAKAHHKGRKLRKMTRWAQFVSLSFAQLSGRCSLRDVVSNISVQTNKLYHLGISKISRTSLARVNELQSFTLYESLFGKLLTRCQGLAPKHGFRFKNKLYSLDASTIDLCLSVFPWAKFRATKGAIKLHVGLDHDGFIPTFVTVTTGNVHEVNLGRTIKLPKQSIVVFDRGYTDFKWFNALNDNDIFFVTRQKSNATFRVIERRQVLKQQGLTCDQTIKIKGSKANDCCAPLRRIAYRDPETGKQYIFLTNNFQLAAKTIANIYKSRWQIELFFKWIKQNLKIKTFLGTTKNAVMTQIWIAMCMYLLMAYIKFCNKFSLSLQQILRLLQLNLFERRSLMGLLVGDPPGPPTEQMQSQLQFT